MSNRAGSKGLLVRLLFLLILGGAAIVIVMNMNSPMAVSPAEVRRMIQKHELVGLSLESAAEMLQHAAPATTDGTVVFDFKQVKGWHAGSVCLDVKDGIVKAATWATPDERLEEGGGT